MSLTWSASAKFPSSSGTRCFGAYQSVNNMPKIIWLYWHQGELKAPEIVKRCIASWRDRNPGWDVKVLDSSTASEASGLDEQWILDRPDISMQFLSDIIRIALLARHGGVWADATVYCARPLDDWLPEHMSSGFFAFEGLRGGRMIASSFLAAEKGNLIPSCLLRALLNTFGKRHFTANQTRWGLKLRAALKPLLGLSPSTTRLWFTPLFTDWLRLYPYFAFHYMFGKLALEDKQFARIWYNTPKLPGAELVKLKKAGKKGLFNDDLRQFITFGTSPAHKLVWQLDVEAAFWREALELLERKRA